MLEILERISHHKKDILVIVVLSLTVLLAILIINYKFTDYPFGPDEYAYQGASRRMIEFGNKDLTIFYPNAALILPYFVGVLSDIVNLDIMILYRIIHIIVIIISIVSFYFLGNYISKKNGILLAVLVSLFHTTTFWLGLGYMVPSTLIFVILPFFLLSLLRSNIKLLILSILFSGFIYWWSLFPLAIMTFIYFLLLKKRYFFLLLGIILSYILYKYILNFDIADLLGGSDLPDWYFLRLWKILAYYAPFVILAFIFVKKMINEKIVKKYFLVSLALVGTNLLIFIFVSEHTQMRTVVFLFAGIFMLFSLLFESISFNKMAGKFLPLIFILFFIPLASGVALNYKNDVFSSTPLLAEELNFFEYHTKVSYPKDSSILSDSATMLISTFNLNDSTYIFYEQIKNKEENGLGWAANFFAQEEFGENDFVYLDGIMAKLNVDSLYIIISPRTKYWINVWEDSGKKFTSRAVSFNIERIAQPFRGEAKFASSPLFKQYYVNQSVKVYQYFSSH
ncbi:MAG: hypothetical protein WC528_02035 [Patescibacteria group bacterium]